MTADAAGNDLAAVPIPVTGFIAIAPVATANVITPEAGGAATLVVPPAYRKLGLIKTDGGFQPTDEAASDPIDFWQAGYRKSTGDANSSLQVGLAQNDPIVREVVRGVAPDANGHIYVDGSGHDLMFLVLTLEVYKSAVTGSLFAEVTNGVCRVGAVERDQSTRGEARGYNVTFDRLVSEHFGGKHYSEWVVNRTAGEPETPDDGA